MVLDVKRYYNIILLLFLPSVKLKFISIRFIDNFLHFFSLSPAEKLHFESKQFHL